MSVVAEYRALRASVIRLWRASAPAPDVCDLADLTRFNESIDQSLTEAVRSYTQRVDRSRQMFLAILAHDLRNPLNAMTMSADLLSETTAHDPDSADLASQITASAAAMGRMIGDLLDYTRTRLGAGMPVAPAPMNLGDLCRDLYDQFRSAHPDRAIHYAATGDLRGDFDADRLRQAVSNLLGNAVQHGAPNAPIGLTLDGMDRHVVIVDVHNGGRPIPRGELTRIFDPLVRGSGAQEPRTNRPGSIGLGLYIAREIARSHGGRIDVASTAAAGTSFRMRIQRHGTAASAPAILDERQVRNM